ncbi:MAG: PP2C family protein-serine/threonine phosphatase [Acidobacteriota bacterium]
MVTNRRLLLAGLLLPGATLVFLGHDLLQSSVLIAWALSFGGATAATILFVSLYRLQLELKASRGELAENRAELDFALQVQRTLFPVHLPQDGGLEFSAVCLPARGISGDYYDVLDLKDGRLAFALADISGKGISAAILMANLQALLRVCVHSSDSPSELCSQLNQHFHGVTEGSRFATCFYGEWHRSDQRLYYVNAGHNPPILIGGVRGLELTRGGFPLGMFPDSEFEVGQVRLEPGNLLVLYSDGVTEHESEEREQFGSARLETVIRSHQSEPLSQIRDRVLEALKSWATKGPNDDMTLVLVRATPHREGSRIEIKQWGQAGLFPGAEALNRSGQRRLAPASCVRRRGAADVADRNFQRHSYSRRVRAVGRFAFPSAWIGRLWRCRPGELPPHRLGTTPDPVGNCVHDGHGS